MSEVEESPKRQSAGDPLATVRFGPCALECAVDPAQALVYLGHRKQELGGELEGRLSTAVAECEASARPRGIGRSFALVRDDAASSEGGIRVAGTPLVLTGSRIASHLEGCDFACLVAVTLGMDNDRAITRAQATSSLDALLLDACSSSLAEQAARSASALVESLAATAGCAITKRYSPGYGDLPLDVQPAFLDVLDAGKLLGIHAGSSKLMTPMKSVTAVIGLHA